MSSMTTRYSHAAPYIRDRVISHADLKLCARTQREQKYHTGVMFGLIEALEILKRSPEGQDSPAGCTQFFGDQRAIQEVKRFVGGPDRMFELGFYE